MKNVRLSFVLMFFFLSVFSVALSQVKGSRPQLVKTNGVTQLYVQGKPFLVLGGELGNSSTSNIDYMRPIWPKLKSMHLNTVLAPVYWELMEPVEGKFDFILIDSMITQARASNLKLVLL